MAETNNIADEKKKKGLRMERFKDGRPPIYHNHSLRKLKGIRPRPPGPLKRFVSRQEWSAQTPKQDNLRPLNLPITHIRYLDRDVDTCHTLEECVGLVRQLQKDDMKHGNADLTYNFVVAPDGMVFEGRGWNFDCDRPEQFAHLAGNWIDIGFIGNNSKKRIPKNMTHAAEDLLDWGVNNDKVRCCHEITPFEKAKPRKPWTPSQVKA